MRYTDPATGKERLIEIPPTLLVTGIGIVPDSARCLTMDAKAAGNTLILVGQTTGNLGGSHLHQVDPGVGPSPIPTTDLDLGPRIARAVHNLIRAGLARSAHDCSDGGLLTAVSEMLIASGSGAATVGADLDLSKVHPDQTVAAFSESPSRYVLEIPTSDLGRVEAALAGIPWCPIGSITDSARLRWSAAAVDTPVADLAQAWLRPLDW